MLNICRKVKQVWYNTSCNFRANNSIRDCWALRE